jgi:hypothetical protein
VPPSGIVTCGSVLGRRSWGLAHEARPATRVGGQRGRCQGAHLPSVGKAAAVGARRSRPSGTCAARAGAAGPRGCIRLGGAIDGTDRAHDGDERRLSERGTGTRPDSILRSTA